MLEKQQKPKFLNLFQISMPVTAIVSILHRLSGLILVLLLPVFIYGFYLSTQSEAQFIELRHMFGTVGFKLLFVGFVWTFVHHILAGIRYLLIDIDIGLSLPQAKFSAWFANLFALIITFIFALGLFR